MQCRKSGGTLVMRVDRGDELVSAILNACQKENVRFGSVTGLGAVDHAVVGLYHVSEKKYDSNVFDGEMEMTALTGNVTTMNGKPYLHLHASFAKADGQVIGGHLNEAVVSGTGEIFIRTVEGGMDRRVDPVTGLNVFDL